MKIIIKNFLVLGLLNVVVYGSDDAGIEDILNMQSELKVDVGSRSGAKNHLDSRSPVDVITFDQIENSGLTKLTDVLAYFVAGFNAPQTSVADGSDHVRVFTLRGMSPDQVLVLINGKRVHTSALMHVNGTIGRGSSSVDLDTIVLSSIQRVEILRDGAAAQYGSDAIAGVINIILKGVGHKNSVSVHGGIRKEGDGKKIQSDAFVSVPLKYDGFLNFSLEVDQSEQTQRAGKDIRLSPPSVKTHVGLPDSKNLGFVLNTEVPLVNTTVLYANSIINYRDSKASTFYRVDSNQSQAKYKDGFLPMMGTKNLDTSLSLGVKGEMFKGIHWDLSDTFGLNKIDYSLDDTMNYDLGSASPSSFDTGSLAFIQNTLNFDVLASLNDLDLSGGLEFKHENYEIKKGEKDSYLGSGSQGFSGYRDENEVDNIRHSLALYFDTTYHFSKDFSVEGALRLENYTDFGSTSDIKLSSAYKPSDELLFRASASTGFRAPSLAQSSYSHTSTFGGKTEGTFRIDDEVSKAFNANDLMPEESIHFTLGSVYEPTKNIYFMFDAFYIKVKDRIMLSGDLVGVTNEQKNIMLANKVSKVRFFTNAVDTKSEGLDFKVKFEHKFKSSSKIDVNFWYNYNSNKVISFNTDTITRENSYDQIDRLENGQPKHSIRFLTNYTLYDFVGTLNLSRYGEYQQVIDNKAYKFEASYITDINLAYNVSKNAKLSLGANNLFDVYPNKWDGLVANSSNPFYGNNGIKPYSRYSPYGYSGSYYYVKASLQW